MASDFLHLSDFAEAELLSLMDSGRWAPAVMDIPDDASEPGRQECGAGVGCRGIPQPRRLRAGHHRDGGRAVQVPGKLDLREPLEDVAGYLQNWFHAIVARTETHEHMTRLADAATIPVINARSDHNHPCEVLGGVAFIRARSRVLDELRVVFVGEATNLCHPVGSRLRRGSRSK